MIRAMFVMGTRPEAIKLCPVIRHMRVHEPEFHIRVCITAQHRELLDQVLETFEVVPDDDLNVMRPGQTLAESTAAILTGVDQVLEENKSDLVIVQGDTTTTFCGGLAAFYRGIPVGHVEAGLRTWDIRAPFPEELNRIITTRVATFHFAPTGRAAQNLRSEGVDESSITVTGNSGIDALLYVRDGLASGRLPSSRWPMLDRRKKLIVVTAHRRESLGEGFEHICRALTILGSRDDVQIVCPVHPNPHVRTVIQQRLQNVPGVWLIEPLQYIPFIDLLMQAYLLLTDSGGVQEEAPSLGKPVLVLRSKTERPEAVEAGTVELVGTDEKTIVGRTTRLLDDPVAYKSRTQAHNPYGDGHASERIAEFIRESFSSRNN